MPQQPPAGPDAPILTIAGRGIADRSERTGSAPQRIPTDAELLAAYRDTRSETAFAEIVRRHGGMVHTTCRRILGVAPEVEDAAQAVFLVLLRRQHAVPGDRLAAWLHGVAVRCARRLARDRRRRGQWEDQARRLPAAEGAASQADHWDAARDALDGALAGLPERLRQAVVLCHLEGLSQRQAAAISGCPVGTMGRRASEGLARLRAVLGRQQVASGVVGLLAQEAACAHATLLPTTLIAAPSAVSSALAAAISTSLTLATAVLAGGALVVALAAALLVPVLRHPDHAHLAPVTSVAAAVASASVPPTETESILVPGEPQLLWRDRFAGQRVDPLHWLVHDPDGRRVVLQDGLRLLGAGDSTVFGTTGIEGVERLPRAGLSITATVQMAPRAHAYALGYGIWPQAARIQESYAVLFANSGLFHLVHVTPGNSAISSPWIELVDLGRYEPHHVYRLKLALRPVGADLYVDDGRGFPRQPTASLHQGSFDGTIFCNSEQQTQTIQAVEVARTAP